MKLMILFMFLFLQACSPFDGNNVKALEAEMKIYNEWIYAFDLKDLKINSEIISRPPGIEQLLFSLILPAEGGLSLKTHCIYYQVPYKNIAGYLKIIESKSEISCSINSSEKPWFEIREIKDLSMKLEKFALNMNFNFQGQKTTWKFLLPNLRGGGTHEKFQPQSDKKLYPAMTLLKISEDTFDPINNKYLGRMNDRMSRGSAIRCFQVDKACKQIGEDRCGDCRYGWYQVVDYICPQGGSRFCGQDHCGEKNEPACVRGSKVVDGEDLGICQNDLTPVPNADHILICQ